jgi:hypothetical protein
MSAITKALPTSGGVPVPSSYNAGAAHWEPNPGDAENGPFVQSNDGAHVTLGAKADAASGTGTGSAIAHLRQIRDSLDGSHHIGEMGGRLVTVAVEVTRPSDSGATPYTAKDVIDTSTTAPAGFVFSNIARQAGGSGYITKALLLTDQKTNTARYRLHLFNAAPTYIVDNGPFTLLYATAGSYVGAIDFDAATTEDGSNSTAALAQKVGSLLPFVCGVTAHLYGMLETLDAFTPAGGQRLTVKLTADQN